MNKLMTGPISDQAFGPNVNFGSTSEYNVCIAWASYQFRTAE